MQGFLLWKTKEGLVSLTYFKKKKKNSKRKPNKVWADQGGKFYNKVFKRFLKINNIAMYSTYNEGKSVVAERSIRTPEKKGF